MTTRRSALVTLLAMAPVGSKILARLDPVLEAWAKKGTPETYESGTWGPDSAFEMLRRSGREWRRP